jgi:hypothetical protein
VSIRKAQRGIKIEIIHTDEFEENNLGALRFLDRRSEILMPN